MISRIGLIESFKDTQRKITENNELAERTIKMQAGTMLFLHGYSAINPVVKNQVSDIIVLEDTSFHCAAFYAKGMEKVAVLNFANAYSPGGGVTNGAMAQEECLCRSSNLYASLTLPYLMKNYYKWNKRNTGDMGTDAVIYSPGVTVFKSDDTIPKDLEEWFQVDVITCAAPYNDLSKKKPASVDKLKQVFTYRITNILEVAAANDVDILILGAFGCGAFNNSPKLVADVFHQLLIVKGYERFFKKVIFAIKRNDEENTNLQEFKKVLLSLGY